MDADKIRDYFTGNFSKKTLVKRVMPINILSLTACLFIAWLLFPLDLNYNIMERTISNLGGHAENPNGWIFFTIGICLWSIQVIPILLYIHKRLSVICKFTTSLATLLGIIGCIFTFLIGIVSDDGSRSIGGISQGTLHTRIALIGIGGLALAFIFYFFPILKDDLSKRGNKQFPPVRVFFAYFFIFFVGIGLATVEIYKEIHNIPWPGQGILSFPLWEWMMLVVFFIFMINISLLLPEEVKPLKENS